MGCNTDPGHGPVRIDPQNWRYFTDESGEAIVFTGSHTWMRKREEGHWVAYGWDLKKFNKYMDFLQYWNLNYIRLWMWEQEGDINIWQKTAEGRFDLNKLNQPYFDRVHSFVLAARSRGIYVGVMLFQGWSGCCEASKADWPRHPMYKDNNINGINGDPAGMDFGEQVHALKNPNIVRFQEEYVRKMINTLNDFDNIIWEIGNETIKSSIPWKKHMVEFIRSYEKTRPKQHLILDGTGNGVGNKSILTTDADTFSPCVTTRWASPDDPYISSPPAPADSLGKPIILDNDHLGNHFLRFTPLNQRNWAWKAFIRGNHPIHMDCYDVFWDGEEPTPNHPIKGVATNPHYDPQRKSLGDIQRFAKKIDLEKMIPVSDSSVCSTTYCLVNADKTWLAYQPDTLGEIVLPLKAGNYEVESFDTVDSSTENSLLRWNGGNKHFFKPAHVLEDWVLLVKMKS